MHTCSGVPLDVRTRRRMLWHGWEGRIEIGADADLVLVDLNLSIQVEDEHTWTRVGWSPYRGRTLKGWPVLTIVDGIPVFERTEHTGPKGRILVEPGTVGRPLTMLPWT